MEPRPVSGRRLVDDLAMVLSWYGVPNTDHLASVHGEWNVVKVTTMDPHRDEIAYTTVELSPRETSHLEADTPIYDQLVREQDARCRIDVMGQLADGLPSWSTTVEFRVDHINRDLLRLLWGDDL